MSRLQGILGVRVYSCHALSELECKKATAELRRRWLIRVWKRIDAQPLSFVVSCHFPDSITHATAYLQAFHPSTGGAQFVSTRNTCYTRSFIAIHNLSVPSVANFHPGIPDPASRKETVQWIRGEFDRNRHIHDLVNGHSLSLDVSAHTGLQAVIEDKLAAGRRELKQILPLLPLR